MVHWEATRGYRRREHRPKLNGGIQLPDSLADTRLSRQTRLGGDRMHTRSHPRRRHEAPLWVLRALNPVLRYSTSRQAYIVRGIGQRWGPVFHVTSRVDK